MEVVFVLALAALLPTIDVSRACHGREEGLPSEQRATAYSDCLQAEQGALTELHQKWTGFPAAAKEPCARLAHTFDSYVELLVCVEIRAGNSLDSHNAK